MNRPKTDQEKLRWLELYYEYIWKNAPNLHKYAIGYADINTRRYE